MTGTDESADEDALFVLSAVLLTPAQFPSVLGDDFPEACAALGLEPYDRGYGLVLGQDGGGARWTVAVDDVSLVAVAIAAWDCGMEYDLSPDERTVVAALPGWPLALSVAAPGIPAPHDPDPEPGVDDDGARPLAPPDTTSWGAAQRRLGADEIALQWEAWREQFDSEDERHRADAAADAAADADARTDSVKDGDGDAGEPAEEKTESATTRDGGELDGTDALHDGVRRVLKELRGYLESSPPPGRIRSGFAPAGARMLRADGPGWSLVARTDDIAYILLDDEPNEVLPVGRGPELPKLLEALDRIAVRPS
ncbi:hypothetical protein GCM10011583_22090 [Streptomyces camponoticapitis]|uniref:Integral membrane protein n=1 Tax=Streptomyces camponoticapitis TaxID=1616125 RepID=A0ABQ2E646_9ACTN|nr:hypothetical protein [Streptomyces camponoticapitis]GGJ90266.1 hypothetical protein GCM10011583_22090 [Streptomyces camponoticapitis]